MFNIFKFALALLSAFVTSNSSQKISIKEPKSLSSYSGKNGSFFRRLAVVADGTVWLIMLLCSDLNPAVYGILVLF